MSFGMYLARARMRFSPSLSLPCACGFPDEFAMVSDPSEEVAESGRKVADPGPSIAGQTGPSHRSESPFPPPSRGAKRGHSESRIPGGDFLGNPP